MRRGFLSALCLVIFVVCSIGEAAPQESGKTTVYVYRQKKFGCSALEPSVFLDDKRVAGMDNGRYFALTVEPGNHVIRSNEKDSEIEQDWVAGKIYFVKINIASGMFKGHGQIAPVSEKQARKEMAKLRPLDAAKVEDAAKEMISLEVLR